jgi:hypothetical protein
MTWEPYHLSCTECGRGMDERYETVWNLVEGWEKRRSQGGTNHLACRRPRNQFRCAGCMEKILNGVAAGQESLAL